jgi:hypothetical protein
MSWLDPRNMFGMPTIKEEGSTVLDSYQYSAQQANNLGASLTTALGQQGATGATIRGAYSGRYIDPFREHEEAIRRVEYILARTVPDYDELVNQFNAIKDIERSNHE